MSLSLLVANYIIDTDESTRQRFTNQKKEVRSESSTKIRV